MDISYRIVCLATFALAAAFAHAANWECIETLDPITDQNIRILHTFGSEVSSNFGTFCPKLAIRLSAPEMDNADDIFIFSPAIKRATNHAAIKMISRIDADTPETSTWIGSDNRCALFCANPTNMFHRLLTSKRLVLRFNHADLERTVIFNTANLSNELYQIKNGSAATKPKTPIMPKPTQCHKCKGKGTIIGWKTCPGCNGAVMPGGSRCKVCIRSIHVGKVRGEISCPVCHPNADTSTETAGFGGGRANYAPQGYYQALRNHARNQALAERRSEADAIGFGYYGDTKNWTKAQRLTTHENQP